MCIFIDQLEKVRENSKVIQCDLVKKVFVRCSGSSLECKFQNSVPNDHPLNLKSFVSMMKTLSVTRNKSPYPLIYFIPVILRTMFIAKVYFLARNKKIMSSRTLSSSINKTILSLQMAKALQWWCFIYVCSLETNKPYEGSKLSHST